MSYKLTPEHAKLWFPVVRELREYYKGKNDKFIENCPLCSMAGKITNQIYEQSEKWLMNCSVCLWYIFEGYYCSAIKGNVSAFREKRYSEWSKQSVKRLKRWERRLKKIIEKENADSKKA